MKAIKHIGHHFWISQYDPEGEFACPLCGEKGDVLQLFSHCHNRCTTVMQTISTIYDSCPFCQENIPDFQELKDTYDHCHRHILHCNGYAAAMLSGELP